MCKGNHWSFPDAAARQKNLSSAPLSLHARTMKCSLRQFNDEATWG